ncbi:hypothetical protein [Piscinibacter gummiphilus]|uniref:Uncharacterized protein n=1 Tax=Piscinibacter gummiphilus TaxID=946333 RepID=A0ABZ0CND0_9BURK|nr:hypothetical protein [Piscinibacter gummiphilus]WOB06502.1 hypothetical protein RXV79_16390 [Piscinibacter gummiphilus]
MRKLPPQDFAVSTDVGGSTLAFTCDMSIGPNGNVRAMLPPHVAANAGFMKRLAKAVEEARNDRDNPARLQIQVLRKNTYVSCTTRGPVVDVISKVVQSYARKS